MKKIKHLLKMVVMIASMLMMTQAAFASADEVKVGQSTAAYVIDANGYRFFKIDNNGTNSIKIATYGDGELQLIWLGKNKITDKNTYENQYYMVSSVKACVDEAAAKTVRTHLGNVCLKGQQIQSGTNYFAIKNNSKERGVASLFIKIGSTGADAPFDISKADDASNVFAAARPADCENNAIEKNVYKCVHLTDRPYFSKTANGLYQEETSFEKPNTKLGHVLDAGTITKPANCADPGEKEQHCTRSGCSFVKVTSVAQDPNNHKELIETVKLEATCMSEGIKEISCEGCSYTKEDSIPKTDHEWDFVRVETPSTCKTEGVQEFSCRFHCGASKTETVAIDPENHTSDDGTITKAATCKEEGEKTYACKECSKVLKTEVIEKTTDHVWDKGVVTKEPTETAAGIMTYTCTICDTTETEEMAALPDSSTPIQSGDHMYTRISTEGVCYEGPLKSAEKVVIPATAQIAGKVYTVTAISEKAFLGNKKLKKVTIPKSVTEIGNKAFYGCPALNTVVMGSKVKTIGAYAFSKCTSLKSIVLPKSVKKVGAYAFYKCKKLKTIKIQTTKLTAKTVGKRAFYKIYSKAKITVPKKKFSNYKKILKKSGVTGKKQRIVKK